MRSPESLLDAMEIRSQTAGMSLLLPAIPIAPRRPGAAPAREAFQRARRAARRRRRARPRDLAGVTALRWRPARPRTVEATTDFDADLRPATDRVARRWEAIARAHHEGRELPPISVLERPDGFYVLDGRHRVSVARAMGRVDIEAWTSPAAPDPRRCG